MAAEDYLDLWEYDEDEGAYEICREAYSNPKATWKTRNGVVLKIVDMEDSHLVNTVNFLRRNASNLEGDLDDNLKRLYPAYGGMLKELANRGIKLKPQTPSLTGRIRNGLVELVKGENLKYGESV
jgi:hypothetical protein